MSKLNLLYASLFIVILLCVFVLGMYVQAQRDYTKICFYQEQISMWQRAAKFCPTTKRIW